MFLPLTFDLGQSEKYILSIRIMADKFMFSISDTGNRNNYCLRETDLPSGTSLLENVKKIIFDFNFLTQQYMQTNVIIVSPEYDLVPDEYFVKSQKEDLYKFVHFGSVGNVLYNENLMQNNVTLYNVEKELFEFLSRNLYNPQFYHHSHLLIKYFEEQSSEVSSRMIIYLHDKMLDILCYSGSQLKHCFTYTDDNPLNQVYYILKIWESCNMDQVNDVLYIAGEVDGSVGTTLQKYIRNIEKTGAFSDIYLWSEDAEKAPLDLLTLAL